MKPSFCLLLALISLISPQVAAQRHEQLHQLATHQLRVTYWQAQPLLPHQPTVVLLSGPTDNWNSDSAWFARLAPKLAQQFQVISIDRASQSLNSTDVVVGYAQFGRDLAQIINQLNLTNIQIIAFASSNLALPHYFQSNPKNPAHSAILIDPDVLSEFSINRYKKDASPFKLKQSEYLQYVRDGKYAQRALEKNTLEMTHLQQLAETDPDTDWDYVKQMFNNRLLTDSLVNLFREIAIYDQDLESAARLELPKSLALTIIDTDFEQTYIDKNEQPDDLHGLIQWKKEAAEYYQLLVNRANKGKYIKLTTREHLLPFSDPQKLIQLLLENPAVKTD